MKARNRMTSAAWLLAALVVAAPFGLLGCSGGDHASNPNPAQPPTPSAKGKEEPATPKPVPPETNEEAELKAERAKLSPEDRALVDAQEWCAISNDERLGSMGAPLKVMVNGQPVFICCKGCQKQALAHPEKTLATVADLKAKAEKDKPHDAGKKP